MHLLYDLPIDLQRKIWEWDDQWKETFQLEVMPYIQSEWFVKWIDLSDNENYGLDIRENCINSKTKKLHSNYIDCKKICEKKNKKKDGYFYLPDHKYYGDMTQTKILLHHNIKYFLFDPSPENNFNGIYEDVYIDGIG
jgi:hypothetical protein